MFVGAHPDDESFGPGGTLAKYAGDGVRVVYACATRGEAGGDETDDAAVHAQLGERRWSELRCAATALGLLSLGAGVGLRTLAATPACLGRPTTGIRGPS